MGSIPPLTTPNPFLFGNCNSTKRFIINLLSLSQFSLRVNKDGTPHIPELASTYYWSEDKIIYGTPTN